MCSNGLSFSFNLSLFYALYCPIFLIELDEYYYLIDLHISHHANHTTNPNHTSNFNNPYHPNNSNNLSHSYNPNHTNNSNKPYNPNHTNNSNST